MNRTIPSFLTVLSLGLLLASCTTGPSTTPNEITASPSSQSSQESSESASPVATTHNVSYIGTIDDLGASIYQQGTHKLVLSDGQFVLLESTDANLTLNSYLGKRVEVRGSVQPTVEGSGTIMRVEQVTVLDASASSSIAAQSSESSAMSAASSSAMTSSTQKSVASPIVSSKAPDNAASSVSSSAPPTNSAALEAQIVLLAKQGYDTDTLWTQKYCTSHIAFCIPVHKNWYFKSFGATTSNLWHVEFGGASIDELYQGPIILNLVSGSSASMNAGEGQVRAQGSDVVGFKDWNDGTHFEIIADARLKAAVEYMLSHITAYTPE